MGLGLKYRLSAQCDLVIHGIVQKYKLYLTRV
jgi:hypothetical protein